MVRSGRSAFRRLHQAVVQRRNVPVLFGAQPFEPRLARMDGEGGHAGLDAEVHQGEEAILRVLIVHADAALHRDRHAHGLAHRRHALGHKLGLAHQAGAEAAALHPVGRTADIEVDLVVAEILADPRRLGQLTRVRPAKLQRHRMFARIVAQEPLPIPAQDRHRGDHLGVEQGAPAQRAVERPAMPVAPVHHRRDGKDFRCVGHGMGQEFRLEGVASVLVRPFTMKHSRWRCLRWTIRSK